ncbi:MAG TPA: hypothetical protein VN108_10760 [Marmoricola sp.]|nr:hypothetical protein [Marmoricola sp.]
MSTIAPHRKTIYEFSLRAALVAAIAVAAVAHLPVIAPHLEEAPYMGVLFIVFTVACLALGVAVAFTGRTWAYQASVAVCGAGVLTYAATRLVAFPQLSDDVGNWFEPLGLVSVASESLVVVLALVTLRQRSRVR